MRISDWSSDVCSSDLAQADQAAHLAVPGVGVAAVGIGFRQRLARIAVHQALQLLLVLGEAAQADGEGTELAPDGDPFGLLRRPLPGEVAGIARLDDRNSVV